MLAHHPGDRPKLWFALDMLAMHGVQEGRPGEVLRISEELLSELRLPPRVGLMARVRRARALADIGDQTRALSELDVARVALEDSIGPRDPSWTWWINELELAGHEGEALLTGGDADWALTGLQRAHELSEDFVQGGRGTLYYTVSILTAYARAGDWPECEATLISLPTMLEVVNSGRNRHGLRTTLREIECTAEAPSWLKDLARDVASTPQLATA